MPHLVRNLCKRPVLVVGSPCRQRRLSSAGTSTKASTGQRPGVVRAGRGVTFKVSHDNGHAWLPGGGGGRSGLREMIYPPSLAKQPFQAPPPPRGYRGSGGGCLKWRYTPLLGAAKFFRELDSSATSTTGGTERRPWPAISAVSLGSILGRRRGHRHRGGGMGFRGGVYLQLTPRSRFFKIRQHQAPG